MAKPAASTVLQGGRAKAYRPIPAADRETAFQAALAAYDRGEFFLTDELLEPAWMGTADTAERELIQGLIKLAAGFVHAARDNALGVRKNLAGAREHLAAAHAAEAAGTAIAVPELASIDVVRLIGDIDRIVAHVARDGGVPLQRPVIRHRARDG